MTRVWFDRRDPVGYADWGAYARQLERRVAEFAARVPDTDELDVRACPVVVASTLPGSGIDFGQGLKHVLILDATISLALQPPALSRLQALHCSILVIQTGSFAISLWSTNVQWPGGTAPTITPGAGASDVIAFIATGHDRVLRGMYTQDFQ